MLRSVIFICLFIHVQAHAQNDDVASLYKAWRNTAHLSIDSDNKQQLVTFVKQAQQLCRDQPDNPQACALSGIIKGHYASQVDKLQSLKFAKQARNDLQHALSLEPTVFDGEAYAELGMLYHLTPGWPFSFGSQPMAERLLGKALEIAPQSVLTNLYLGEFLYNQQRTQEAAQYLQTALIVAEHHKLQSGLDYPLLRARNMLNKIQK